MKGGNLLFNFKKMSKRGPKSKKMLGIFNTSDSATRQMS